MTESNAPAWGGDPSIAWRIVLSCVPAQALSADTLAERQRALHAAQGWPAPPDVVTGAAAAVLREFAGLNDDVVVVGSRDHLELWSPQRWDDYNRQMEDPEVLAQHLQGLGI